MPRIPRKYLTAEDITYHVFNRGNGKMIVFHDDRDFQQFLSLIKKYKQKYPIQIFHWVLMDNHFHFILTIDPPELITKCIGGLTQAYAQYHHKRWDSAGRLWQGRFKSQPVQREEYLHECGRYIERNPFRANKVDLPWKYKWSSCNFYINNQKDEIITTDSNYNGFGNNANERIQNYKKWLLENEDKRFANMDLPVGNDSFTSMLLRKKGRLVNKKKGRPPINTF